MSGSNSAERKRHEPLVLVETADLSEEDWLDYRRRGIGGSDVSAIFGTSPFRTARDLYYDKLNIASVEDDEGNWVAMEMGHLLEPLVAKIFERKTGYRVYQIKKMFQHPQYPWMLADVDYFVELSDGTTAILEIKTTNYNARDNWWMNGKETVPVYYESQGRHYMAVTDLDRCFFCCLYGNNEEEVIIREVKRDFEYEAEMVFLEQYFWENHVQRHVPPPYTESGALIIESARKHFGPADKNAPAVALDLDMTAKLMQYLRLLDEKKNAEVYSKEIDKDIQRLKALLIAEMGTSCTAICEQEGVNYTVTYLDIYRLDRYRAEIVRMDGFGEKSWQRLWDAIQQSRNTTFERYLISMDIPMIGNTASKVLGRVFHYDLDEFRDAVYGGYDFRQLPDFGETLHNNIHDWFCVEDNFCIWEELQTMMNIQKPAVAEHSEDRGQDNPFVGKTIVVTGKVEPYTRDGINDLIESLGAHAGSSVSKKTDYLVCGENAGSKLSKARDLGVTVLSPAEFFSMAGAE